jgi:hypothetical protein
LRKSKSTLIVALSVAVLAMTPLVAFGDIGAEYSPKGTGNVVILVQNGDPEMIYYALLYASRAMRNQWMDNVKVIFWGPAEKTIVGLAADSDQIKMLKEIQAMGGKHGRVWACKACADRYGVADQMLKLGFEVFHTGEATSYLIKLGYRLWTW